MVAGYSAADALLHHAYLLRGERRVRDSKDPCCQERIKSLRQANDGERSVAEYLDILREQDGMRVLHDIEGEGFNLDHVVIAQQGIYVIETKTISKPEESYSRIDYDGTSVRIDGFTPTKNPVDQAQAEARWLRQLLKDSLRREYPIRPVVVFPGWYIESSPESKRSKVWVLNPKSLQGFIRQEPMALSTKDMAEVGTFLKRYVRSTPRQRSV